MAAKSEQTVTLNEPQPQAGAAAAAEQAQAKPLQTSYTLSAGSEKRVERRAAVARDLSCFIFKHGTFRVCLLAFSRLSVRLSVCLSR